MSENDDKIVDFPGGKTTAQTLGVPDDPVTEAVLRLMWRGAAAKAGAVRLASSYEDMLRLEWTFAEEIIAAVREADHG